MVQRNKILGRFLLTTYLLVAINCSFSHGHTALFDDSCEATHCHEDFEEVHHAHDFHIGIFHFLGHLFEELRHVDTDDLGDDHVVILPKLPAKKNIDLNNSDNFHFVINKSVIVKVDAESLSDPPAFSFSLLQRLIKSDAPLRAPPALA